MLLTACIVTSDSIEGNPKDPRAQDIADRVRSLDLSPRQTTEPGPGGIGRQTASRPQIYLSDGTRPQGAALVESDGTGTSGYDLNFENAPVATVAKVILGDVLGVGYTIDPRVQGTVTMASVRPVPKADALYVLENALRMSGVALLRDRGGSYRLLPATEAGPGGIDRSASAEAGQGISVVPLRYVSAQNVFKLLDAFGVRAGAIRPDNNRNTLMITGSGSDRAAAIDTILSFDADWMRGQSVGIFPVRNSSPEPLISEIEKIMDSGDGGIGQSMVKFQAIARLNAILVVSQKPEYLKRAQTWIARLDKSDTEGVNMKSYPLRYGQAKQVVALLNEMLVGLGAPSGNFENASSQLSPGSGISTSSSGPPPASVAALSGLPTAAAGATTPVTGPPGSLMNARPVPGPGTSLGTTQDQTPGAASGSTTRQAVAPPVQNVRITADIANNAVLVYANMESQRIVEQTIRQIDRPQRQIAIEATIAEVTLNDRLNYGVQFFLASKQGSLSNTIATQPGPLNTVEPPSNAVNAAANALINRAIPGFNLLVGAENSPRVILDALHGVTDVKVLSNPSLVVLDNQPATLQVGDQVPFSTGTATVLTTANTVVNTIDYKNTGIILRVLPRANANGNIVLDIEQEISNVSTTTNTGPLTPTISQRRVKSSIAVTSGQTVLLAGLISESENKQRQGIPLLDSIPGVGDAFSHQTFTRARTELILFIRPTVVKDAVDAHVIAEEMRSKMNSRLVGTSNRVIVVDPNTGAAR